MPALSAEWQLDVRAGTSPWPPQPLAREPDRREGS